MLRSSKSVPSRCARLAQVSRLGPSLVLAALLAACGAEPPEPPVPDNLAELDPFTRTRILEAVENVREDPSRASSWADLSTVYTDERLKQLSIECLGVAERLDPREPRWPYRSAILLVQLGHNLEAIAAIERSIALEPSYPPSHARLGRYRLDLGELEAAERSFRTAIQLDSSYPGGWVGLARVELQRDRAAEAVAILERLSREDPESRTFRQLLAVAQLQLDPAAPASAPDLIAGGAEPVWNDPWELETHSSVRRPLQEAELLIGAGKLPEALALLQEERARGTDPDALAYLFATVYQEQGNSAEAQRELDPLLVSQPDNARALMLSSRVLNDLGDYARAVETLERVTELQPTNGGAYAVMALHLSSLGEHERAVEAYRRARALGLGDFKLRRGLGNSLVMLRRWPEAIELFEALLVERPDHGDVWLQLALARARTGALDSALVAFERARACGNASPRLTEQVRSVIESARSRRAAGTEAER